MKLRILRIVLALTLVASLGGGAYLVVSATRQSARTHVVAYFQNTDGLFVGDDVRIRGVNVGRIEAIEPQPTRAKVSFWIDDTFKVPVDAKAVILSPTLVTARAIQLTPPYVSGATLSNNAVIPQNRTAVPVEWDDVRNQLERLTTALQPTEPGGVSTLGALVNTTADNLRGQGSAIRDSVIKLSEALSALGDHSDDTFSAIRNLSLLVTALQDSTTVMRQLNENLASVTALMANDPDELGTAVSDLNSVLGEVTSFVRDNRSAVSTSSERLASVTQALTDSIGDIKQFLHSAPTSFANLANIYQPSQGTFTGILSANNFSNPITFICGAIQAASRLNAEQSSKLCVQYLAPIVKNRQFNFPPLGLNPFVGTSARPNEITYSEDWMRPDYVPPAPPGPSTPGTPGTAQVDHISAPLPAEAATPSPDVAPSRATDPAEGLGGMMLPPGAGS
ncbi:mammalian cell entry protein [Mycolicibacterium novocastrense]|uniref:MCE family protein n=1 Tax=Mycolicibacterium novocastrense TaxID=59813 RepID=UPI000748B8EE|nr:MCE family protein [Mycolicibacterium novocastrense]KUH69797.1 mammalian cell entry protein [Mycolicibacterium novocastrense]KUH71346.1 mammalian cell entry protein [Mycolicibacterium novocastrense]KUH74410.1 mammalian cell entry protein [Mycolicibacterium novocastrense]